MRTFKEMNKSTGDTCPICGTQKDGEVVLIGIQGTEQDRIIEAKQFHLECIELRYIPTHNGHPNMLYQSFNDTHNSTKGEGDER